MLNKQFKERDIQRMRNLIRGEYGAKTTTFIGELDEEVEHSEGDVWTEKGRQWTIKDGIKQPVTKMDEATRYNRVPMFCPKCNNSMSHRNDIFAYKKHKTCFDCLLDAEQELKKSGKWDEHQKKTHNDYIDSIIEDFRDFVKGSSNMSNGVVHDNGTIESVSGNAQKILDEQLKKSIEILESKKVS